MQPTKFQINFWDAVKAALEFKAITNKEAREHRRKFWLYNYEQHRDLYIMLMEQTMKKMKLVHLKRKLRDRQSLLKIHRKSGFPAPITKS